MKTIFMKFLLKHLIDYNLSKNLLYKRRHIFILTSAIKRFLIISFPLKINPSSSTVCTRRAHPLTPRKDCTNIYQEETSICHRQPF